MMMPLKTAAAIQATGPADPSWRVISEGRPKMPLPIMELTMSAARLQRPILRTKPPRAAFALCTARVVTQLSYKAYENSQRIEETFCSGSTRVQPAACGYPSNSQDGFQSGGRGGLPMGIFLWLFFVLLVLWLIFWLAVHVTSGLIHLLLVVAVISLIVHFVRGPRRSTV